MHFVKSMHIAHRSTSWSEHLEFAWKNTCVYENNKYIICKCNTSFPLDLVWSILVTQAECWKKQSTQDMRKWIYVYNDMFVAQFLCFIPYHISQSSACYVYKQYNVYTYTFMYNIYIYNMYIYMYSLVTSRPFSTTPRFDRPWLGSVGERMSGSLKLGSITSKLGYKRWKTTISVLLFKDCFNTPLHHTPGNPPSQLWKKSLFSLFIKV